MITRWYIGFTGDYEGRPRAWHDIFTDKEFRHCLVIGFCPLNRVWIYYDPLTTGTTLEVFNSADRAIDLIVLHVCENGKWLKVQPSNNLFKLGQWRMYCVPAIKHLLGFRSCALTPRGLYRDLVKAGATPAFERNYNGQRNKRTKETEATGAERGRKKARSLTRTRTTTGGSRTH